MAKLKGGSYVAGLLTVEGPCIAEEFSKPDGATLVTIRTANPPTVGIIPKVDASASNLVDSIISELNGVITVNGATIIEGGNGVSLSPGTGRLLIGNPEAGHIAIDENEIQAKSNGTTAATLALNNDGGSVVCGGDLDVVGDLSTNRALIANTFIDTGVYLQTQEGFLITTDIPVTEVMTFLEFTMHAFSSGYPALGIVQCYPYPESSAILQPKYTAIGNAPPYCKIFYANSKLCFWFPAIGEYTTMHPVLHTWESSRYKILSTTAEALPSSRTWEVTANVLLPWSSINRSGSDADLLDGQHGSYYVPASRTLTAGDGLSGGGTLAENRSFAVDSTVVRTSGDQSISGTKTFTSTIAGSISGNAATATKLATARNINGVSFDGTTDITISTGTSVTYAKSTSATYYNILWVAQGVGTLTQVYSTDTILVKPSAGEIKATAFNATSLRSAKTDIRPFHRNALEIIRNTQICTYYYKTDESKAHLRTGFIADDTDEALATKNHDSMDIASSVGVLMKAVQELDAIVQKQAAEIENLKQPFWRRWFN